LIRVKQYWGYDAQQMTLQAMQSAVSNRKAQPTTFHTADFVPVNAVSTLLL
jgi:hypothetical protein